MLATAGLAAEIASAFQTANVEMLAVSVPDAMVIAVTSAALSRWNCREEDVCGKQLAKFGTGPLSARHVTEETETGVKQKIDVAYAPPLGAVRTLTFAMQTWRDGDKEFMILIGQHGNQAEAEEAIQNERRLHLALRSGGYAVWDFDFRSGQTVNSPEMYDILGYERGSKDLDFDKFNKRVHPEDQDKTLDGKIRNAPFGADLFQTKYRVKSSGGEYLWIESIAGVIRDPSDGKPAKAVGLCRNITDQMNTIEKIRLSERNLRRSQAAAKLGSFVIKQGGGPVKLSSEMVTLLELDDAVMPPTLAVFQSMLEPEDRERFAEALEFASLGKAISGIEVAAKLKSGEFRYFQCNLDPELDQNGQVTSLFGTCQCITERKLLERKFLQAQKMEAVGQLTGGIAHDFNNLLMVVIGNLQLVDQLVRGDERATKRIKAAIEAADKGSELTKRMLAFSRQSQLLNKDISVNELVLRNQDMLRQAIGASVDLKVMPSPDTWPVRADITQLETAILNLCINARDAMKPKGGSLIIETGNATLDAAYAKQNEDVIPGEYVQISVTDTGCGIASDNLEKVFQPFFTTKGPEAGSGLGLSMIYGFVKQSGGHVKIYSEIGHGTTVKLFLPRAGTVETPLSANVAVPPSAAAQADQAAASEPPPRKTVVLVVEDNEAVRDVASAMIEEMGFETLQASSGPEGLKVIEQRGDIDLVLSDVIMAGGMNGPELALRALKVRPDLRVLFMSGYAPGSVRQMQDLPDTIDLVSKPFTRNDLTAKVRRALAA